MEAHSLMLWRIGVLPFGDLGEILEALDEIEKEYENDRFQLTEELEDVHMNIENRVIERVGESGEMMHLARSRNDQVMADTRLYLREQILDLQGLLRSMMSALLDLASRHKTTVMPFYTHTRGAQPTTFAHVILSYAHALLRDVQRLEEVFLRVNLNPLGAAAGGGTGFPIDRELTSRLLGFYDPQENTLDVVTSRGEAEIEILSDLSLLFVHLSRIAQDLILWSSEEFGMIKIGSKFVSGSSLMPQKTNPDYLELVRARASEIHGLLMESLSILKGLPSGYNRDTQLTKGAVFRALDSSRETLEIFPDLMESLEANPARMLELSGRSPVLATDLVELLVLQGGMTFRGAYRLVKRVVEGLVEERGQLPVTLRSELERLGDEAPELDYDVILDALTPLDSVSRRRHLGGPSPDAVEESIKKAREQLEESSLASDTRRQRIEDATVALKKVVSAVLEGEEEKARDMLHSLSEA